MGNFWISGICADQLTVTNTTINATIKNISIPNIDDFLLFNTFSTTGHCILNSCNITAICDVNHLYRNGTPHKSNGMYITGNITLNNSNITAFGNGCGIICDQFNGNSGTINSSAKSTLAACSSTGFSAFTLNLNGAVINATAESTYMAMAVSAYNANIKSGTINAECKGTSEYSYGIWGYLFNMTGGNITAKACAITSNGTESHGIRAKEEFKISDGELIASGYTNAICSISYDASKYISPKIFVGNTVDPANAKKTEDIKAIESALYVKFFQKSHTHTYDSNWNYNEEGHWHNANCGHTEKSEYATHKFSNNSCSICGYEKPVSSTVSNTSSTTDNTSSIKNNVSSKPSGTVSNNSSVESNTSSKPSGTVSNNSSVESNTSSKPSDTVSNNSSVESNISSTTSDTVSDNSSVESNISSATSDTVSDNSSVEGTSIGNQGNDLHQPKDLTALWIGIGILIIIAAVATILIVIKKK